MHRLIRENCAALVEGPEEVLEALDLPLPDAAEETLRAGGPAARLLEALGGGETRDADELARSTGLPVGEVRALLVDLELDGAVLGLPGGLYARR